ncbi:MAG: glucosaminidase domain-containing protein [Flavobacteriaceae bacterium]|nr:glucosaminidase domain-containing protein [Flavobacteriaceae bacterium]
MRSKQLFILILTLVLVSSCGSKKKVVSGDKERKTEQSAGRNVNSPAEAQKERLPVKSYKDVVEEYIDGYAEIAKEEMELYKIPASITLAQGILESGAGQGELTRRANNHFGIKCHEWQGDKVYHDDDRSQECFRKYKDSKYSYRDHSLFLSERRRYSGLFELDPDDYEAWANGLRAAGYATDRKYPAKLIDLIERYQLDRFDAEVLGKKSRNWPVVKQNNSIGYIVQKGDTLYSISKRFNITVEILKENNNLNSNNIAVGQELNVQSAPDKF